MPQLTILGGGPAGLAAAFFARQAGLSFTLLEAAPRVGGNAVTFQEGAFRFDSGAHRFHDQDPEMTRLVKSLLGDDLLACNIPSQIFHRGGWVDFPLSPFNLLKSLGVRACGRAAHSLARERLKGPPKDASFESYAIRAYGRDIADRFLLGYSEKLWGLPCHRLSPSISGARLQGLSLRTFLLETTVGRRAKTKHLDGKFYYPRHGFGMIADKLADAAGREHLRTGAKVTRVLHEGGQIRSVEINGRELLPVKHLISTLPLPVLARLLDPAPPEHVLAEAGRLRFRNVLLAAVFLNRPSVTRVGSVYFPDLGCPMTRVYEPKNRSSAMAPSDQTMLAVEIPCDASDALWRASDADILALVEKQLEAAQWFSPKDVLGGCVKRLPTAYPVLELGAEDRVRAVLDTLHSFRNFESIGRNGMFRYNHTHHMLRFGQKAVANVVQPAASPGGPRSRAH